MGACTVTQPTYGSIPQNLGHKYFIYNISVALSATYAAGGDSITPAQIGFGSEIVAMLVNSFAASQTTFWLFVLNTTNNAAYTIQAFTANGTPSNSTPLTEANAGTNLSALTFQAAFIGV